MHNQARITDSSKRESALSANIEPKLSEVDKPHLTAALSRICVLQKRYGRNAAELETLVDGYLWTLGDYTLRQVLWALKEYTKRSADIPAPSDLISLMEEGRKSRIDAKKQLEPVSERDKNPLVERERQARKLQVAYWEHFHVSPQAQVFATPMQKSILRAYVRAAAWLQAQMIVGLQNCGVCWVDLLCEMPDREVCRKEIMEEAGQAKERGAISVVLPIRLYHAAGIQKDDV
jgi:hypothetical protein